MACLAALSTSAEEIALPAVDGSDSNWFAQVQKNLAEREYRLSENATGVLQAPNRAHDLRIHFSAAGMQVTDRTEEQKTLMSLRYRGITRGVAKVQSADPAQGLRHENNRAELDHGAGVIEWYVNSHEGLEHGFTLQQRPAGQLPLRILLDASDIRVGSRQQRTLAFAAAASSLGEADGNATLAVVLTTDDGQPSGKVVQVSYQSADGTTSAGADYNAVSDTLAFPAGTASGATQNIQVAITADDLDEADETFALNLSTPVEADLGAISSHTVTITDDDTAAISVSAISGNTSENGGTASFTLVLNSQPTADVSVALSSSDLSEGRLPLPVSPLALATGARRRLSPLLVWTMRWKMAIWPIRSSLPPLPVVTASTRASTRPMSR